MSRTIDLNATAGLTHHEAMALQAVELERTLELLRQFDERDWATRTDCPAWDVRRMYLHVLGACDSGASLRETVHQMRAAKRLQRTAGGPLEANLSAVQVREREDISPVDLVARLAAVAPRTVRTRTKLPSLVRRSKMKVDGPVHETWTLGYLTDTIYLRDLWMHRVDAARATGRTLVLTADHDGRIVADVVAEWARRHGRPFTLTLTGEAGGSFTSPGADPAPAEGASAPEAIELDAIEFCRVLASRAEGTGLLATIVPF